MSSFPHLYILILELACKQNVLINQQKNTVKYFFTFTHTYYITGRYAVLPTLKISVKTSQLFLCIMIVF